MKTTTQTFVLLLLVLGASAKFFGRTNIFPSNRGTPGDAFSLPEIKSSSKRLLIRRMRKDKHNEIRTPGTGLFIYRTLFPVLVITTPQNGRPLLHLPPQQKNSDTKIL